MFLFFFFFFSSRRRHTRCSRDWSSDVCSSDLAWIGSSFYFIWLDRALTKPEHPKSGVEGDLWMVHSGGVYQGEKRLPGPGGVPAGVHWFKLEAKVARITGHALLGVIY